MRVGQRLFAAVVPAILGVFTVAGLAYWGQYAHTAPQWLVVVAVVASVLSLVLAWTNTRYVVRRIESLAGRRKDRSARRSANAGIAIANVAGALGVPGAIPEDSDELDDIEDVVDRLSEALASADAARLAATERAEARGKEYAELMEAASAVVERELEQIRLPLHILLENHFGDLNENQEEMLGAARTAAEAADAQLERLKRIAELDLGSTPLRRDPVKVADVVGSLLQGLRADGEARGVSISIDGVAPALPAVMGDRNRLQEALSTLLRGSVRSASEGSVVNVSAESERGGIIVAISPGISETDNAEMKLASRLIHAQGGTVQTTPGQTRIWLAR